MTQDEVVSEPGCRAHVLIAEDDGPSSKFFSIAFQDMHCRVDLAATGERALRLARRHPYDLLLLDCRMPDFGAIHILSVLRSEPDAASHASPALATSAEFDAAQRQQFRQIGFADTVLKPVSMQTLRRIAEAQLPAMPEATDPLLDDMAALDTSGSTESVSALRKLFVCELERLSGELDRHTCRGAELNERLHRLLASCGFCGAKALAEATRALKRKLDDGAVSNDDMKQFREILSGTLEALTQAD